MSFPGFCYESENNDTNARVGCYISNKINYIRRTDLEGLNSHLLILDIKSEKDLRIINIYRTFNPQNGMSPREMFDNQLKLINDAMTNNTLLLGDLNLDWQKRAMQTMRLKTISKNLTEY
jgi:Holliday junction resolvase RusA-like endonuclease